MTGVFAILREFPASRKANHFFREFGAKMVDLTISFGIVTIRNNSRRTRGGPSSWEVVRGKIVC